MDTNKEVNIYFKVEGLDGYIQNLDDLKSALGQVETATDDATEATSKLESAADNLDIMEGAVKTLAGSFEILAGSAALLGVEDNEFFKSMEENVIGVISLAQGAIDASEGVRKLAESEKIAKYWQDAMNASAKANPYVLLGVAVAALAVGIAAYAASAKDANDIADELVNKTSKKAQQEYAKEASKVEILKEQYKLAGDNLKERKKIIGQLQEINPDYFGNLDAEKTSYDNLKDSVKDYNDEVLRQAIQKAFGDELIEATTQKLLKQDELATAKQELYNARVNESIALRNNQISVANDFSDSTIRMGNEANNAQAKVDNLEAELSTIDTTIAALNGKIATAASNTKDFGDEADEAAGDVDTLTTAVGDFFDEFDNPENEPLSLDDLVDPELQSDLNEWKLGRDAIRDKEKADEQAWTDDYDAFIEQRMNADNEYLENREINEAEQERLDKERKQRNLDLVIDSIEAADMVNSALIELSNATFKERLKNAEEGSKEEEQILKEQFERNKKFQIAQALITTAAAVVGQLAVPKDQLTGANFIKAAAAAVAGGLQIAAIKKTTFDGGSDLSSVNVNPSSSINYSFGQQAGSALELGQSSTGQQLPPVQTYVLASDVTSAQQAQQQIQNLSRL